jgi:hypothetical protein
MGVFKLPRATTTERLTITPAVGELVYDTDLDAVYKGDGVTVGGVLIGDGSGYVESVTGNLVDNTDPINPVVSGVEGVTGTGVDNTDPANPVISQSPYDLTQVGASDADVLTWVAANSRYEPVAPSGGGSLFTDATSFIYRDGPVQVGKTTATDGASGNNVTLVAQSKFSNSTYKMVQFLSNSGTELFHLRNDGLSTYSGNVSFGGAGALTNVGLISKSSGDTGSTLAARFTNNSGAVLMDIFGDSTVRFVSSRVGIQATPASNIAFSVKTPATNQFSLALYTAAGGFGMLVNNNMDLMPIGGAFFGNPNGFTAPTGRVNIRGAGTTTANTLLLEDSAGTDNAVFLDNGQIRMLRLPVASAGLAVGSLWNNSGVINIV